MRRSSHAAGRCTKSDLAGIPYAIPSAGLQWICLASGAAFTGYPGSSHACSRNQPPPPGVPQSVLVPEAIREFFRCKILRPLLRQLRGGASPRRIAWSLALGMIIGINPSVGITTVLVVMLAWAFGLNQVASQIGAHAMTPLHLLLFLPFIEVGVHLFHTRSLPLSRRQIEHLSHHPWRLIRDIWQWEWHALIVWGLFSAIALPLLARYIRRALVLLMRRHRTLVRSRPALHSAE
jgi:uncharacterized protein (DUF2062 family)